MAVGVSLEDGRLSYDNRPWLAPFEIYPQSPSYMSISHRSISWFSLEAGFSHIFSVLDHYISSHSLHASVPRRRKPVILDRVGISTSRVETLQIRLRGDVLHALALRGWARISLFFITEWPSSKSPPFLLDCRLPSQSGMP